MEWNSILAQKFFTPDDAGLPVYLDMDDQVIDHLAARVGCSASEVTRQLTEAVRGCLFLDPDDGRRMFARFDQQLKAWKARHAARSAGHGSMDINSPPPVVALLAVFVLAAEKMGRDVESGLRATAYYTPLLGTLGLEISQLPRLTNSFRRSSETYWESLGRWLEELGGQYGLPSARAHGHRFIGLPVSQALIRRAERAQLHQMFGAVGLTPRQTMTNIEMQALIDEWIECGHSVPKNFQRLWGDNELRERVADLAVLELENWPGGGAVDIALARNRSGPFRIVSWTVHRSLRKQLELAVTRPGQPAAGESWTVRLTSGPRHFDCRPITPSMKGLVASAIGASNAELLEGDLIIVDKNSVQLQRVPSPLIVMRFDELSERWVEIERAHVGEPLRVMIRSASGNLENRLGSYLQRCAMDGYRKLSINGIPDGWQVYDGVELTSKAYDFDESLYYDLRRLQPEPPDRITFNGGLRLPGRVERYSAHLAPFVVVTPREGVDHKVRISRDPDGPPSPDPDADETITLRPGVIDLKPAWTHGDYRIEVLSGENIIESRSLKLRSGSTPLEVDDTDRLVHSRTGLGAVRAEKADPARAYVVDGCLSHGPETDIAPKTPSPFPVWRFGRSEAPVRGLDIPAASSITCLSTAIHHVKVETSSDGKWNVQRYTCCGIVKRTPTRPYRPGRRSAVSTPSSAATGNRDAPTQRLQLNAVLDAMFYLRQGNQAGVARLLSQTDRKETPTAFVLRDLSSLGHVAVERGASSASSTWQIVPPTLVKLENGNIGLAGAWAPLIHEVGEIVTDLHGALRFSDDPLERLPLISGIGARALLEYEDTFAEVVYSGPAASRMILRLPHLAAVLDELPVEDLPTLGPWEVFSLSPLQWRPVRAPDTQGLFRRELYTSHEYYFRTSEDVSAGKVRPVFPELGKHLLAMTTNQSLIAYDAATGKLRVPMGARLPGLYERALCLCSGQIPYRDPEYTNTYVYDHVPARIACALTGRFTH